MPAGYGGMDITLAAGALFTTLITTAFLAAALFFSRNSQTGGHRSGTITGRSNLLTIVNSRIVV